MDDSKLTRLLRSYFLLRDQLLPIGEGRGSVMMRELLLHILNADINNTPLTLKRCYLTFPSATKIIRRDLQLLMADGLIEMNRAPRDRRSVLISPSALTLGRLAALARHVDDPSFASDGAIGATPTSGQSFNPLISKTLFIGGGRPPGQN